jgi:nucleotide-binding universal stress UspA family protein
MTRVLLRRIVCAVDLSDRSAPLLRHALQLAQLHGGKLIVVHVTNATRASADSTQLSATDAFAPLRHLTDAARLDAVPVRWIMAHGNPALELPRMVRSMDADLAIVGGALPRPSTGVVGTVAEAILRTTACPVLVVSRTPDDGTSRAPFHDILCAVSSGLARSTLRYALSFAQELESRLTILNVDDGVDRIAEIGLRTGIDQLRSAIPDSARAWSVIDERVVSGAPAQELVKAARELNTDLIVVGSTAVPGSDGGLGSVALGALALTDACILIVPAPGLAIPTSGHAGGVGATPAAGLTQ